MAEGGVLGMIPGLVKAGLGVGQTIAGLLTKTGPRPDYLIPEEYQDNIKSANNFMNTGMDQGVYNKAQDNIQRNQNFGFSQLKARRGLLAGVSSLVQQSNDANLGLDTQAATILNNNRRVGLSALMSARNAFANQQLEKQNWDKFGKYTEQVQKKQGLLGAGMQNIAGGADEAAAAEINKNMKPSGNTYSNGY